MKNRVSVLITVRNMGMCIGNCLRSLLSQTFADFEIIVVDDVSVDETERVIREFNDPRIRYFKNKTWLGLSQSRNECVKYARGDFVFFTDGDCVVAKNWVEEGLKSFETFDCLGVEGKTYYVSEDYYPTRSDDVVENKAGGLFMTCNMAYKKTAVQEVGGFDPRFTFLEDRDLALRVLRNGKISFNPRMIVFHEKRTLSPKKFVKAKVLRNRVLLFKKSKDTALIAGRIAFPKDLQAILFPPLVFSSLLRRSKYKTREDFAVFPYIYVELVLERLFFWEMCAKEKVFLI